MLTSAQKSDIFKRFIFCLSLFKLDNKKEIIDSITDHKNVEEFLNSNCSLSHHEYLLSIYNYEFEIYQLVISNIDIYIDLLDERVSTLSRIRKIIENKKTNILDQNIIVNKDNKVINSKYNWALFFDLNEESFYLIVENNRLDNYSLLIRPSIISNVFFDEIVLDFELKLLKDILKIDDFFNGNDIVDTIMDGIDDRNNSQLIEESIKIEVTNALLLYIIYFNALKII